MTKREAKEIMEENRTSSSKKTKITLALTILSSQMIEKLLLTHYYLEWENIMSSGLEVLDSKKKCRLKSNRCSKIFSDSASLEFSNLRK